MTFKMIVSDVSVIFSIKYIKKHHISNTYDLSYLICVMNRPKCIFLPPK